MEVPPNHPVVLDDYDFVLKPMVTTGDPPLLKKSPLNYIANTNQMS